MMTMNSANSRTLGDKTGPGDGVIRFITTSYVLAVPYMATVFAG